MQCNKCPLYSNLIFIALSSKAGNLSYIRTPKTITKMVLAFCQDIHLSISMDFSFWTIFEKITHRARRGGPPTCLQTLLEVFKLGYIDSAELLLVYVCSSCLTGATLYDVHSCPINTCQSSTYPFDRQPSALQRKGQRKYFEFLKAPNEGAGLLLPLQ